MRDQVQATIDILRPAIQADGADIFLRDVDEATGVVTVEFAGSGCAACPSSTVTLNAGIARILKDRVEGITAVRQIEPGTAPAETAVSL
ncbi:MAG: NifU family protein [Acidimicrobiales bacterium]|nr:NifU family protein [Acidimicrobiales bacterium]